MIKEQMKNLEKRYVAPVCMAKEITVRMVIAASTETITDSGMDEEL